MKRIYLYFEVLIAMSIYRLFSTIIKELTFLGNTAEFYSRYDCHFWQQRKVLTIYNKLKEQALKEHLKKVNNDE